MASHAAASNATSPNGSFQAEGAAKTRDRRIKSATACGGGALVLGDALNSRVTYMATQSILAEWRGYDDESLDQPREGGRTDRVAEQKDALVGG